MLNRQVVLYFLLPLIAISQTCNALYGLYLTGDKNFAIYPRALTLSLLIVLVLRSKFSSLPLVALTLGVFIVILNSAVVGDAYNLFSNLYFAIKIVYPLFFLSVAANLRYYLNDLPLSHRYFKGIALYIWLIPLFSIISLVVGWDLGKTYEQDYRFGYNGIIGSQNEVAIIYTLVAFFALNSFESFSGRVLFFLSCFALMISGTKAALGICVLLLLFAFYRHFLRPKVIILVVCLAFSLIPFFWQDLGQVLSALWQYVSSQSASTGSLFTALSSGRDLKLENILNSSSIPLLQALAIGGIVQFNVTTEMDLVDLVLFGGLVYFALYLSLMTSYFFKLNDLNEKGAIFFLLIIIMALSGHLIYAVSSFELLFLICVFMYAKNSKKIVAES